MKTYKEFIAEVKIDQADYDKWKKEQDDIQKDVDKTSSILQKFGTIDVSDEVRNKPDFKKAKKEYDIAFKKLQDFNKKSDKKYLKKSAMDKRTSWKKG